MMAMVFLPTEYPEQHYNKQTVLDMLLVHDMAEGILGDVPSQLSEPTKELKAENALMRKLFLKGTYPEVANMTHYYEVWADYFEGTNINARIARDVNLIQTVNTFFAYFSEQPTRYTLDTVKGWLSEGEKLSTDIGYDLFDRIIVRNPIYRKAVDGLITAAKAGE
jgi:5'-deoxynucleotidase YfbR-like HD superfamily hydrolase